MMIMSKQGHIILLVLKPDKFGTGSGARLAISKPGIPLVSRTNCLALFSFLPLSSFIESEQIGKELIFTLVVIGVETVDPDGTIVWLCECLQVKYERMIAGYYRS